MALPLAYINSNPNVSIGDIQKYPHLPWHFGALSPTFVNNITLRNAMSQMNYLRHWDSLIISSELNMNDVLAIATIIPTCLNTVFMNKNISFEMINDPKFPWDIVEQATNYLKDFPDGAATFSKLKKHPDFAKYSSNITIELLFDNLKTFPWDFKALSANPYIDAQQLAEHFPERINWTELSTNPTLTVSFIEKNISELDVSKLVKNSFILDEESAMNTWARLCESVAIV